MSEEGGVQGKDYPHEDKDNSLAPVQRQQVAQVIMKFPDVFSETPGMAKGWKHTILTPPDTVARMPVRPIPLALQPVLQQEVGEMVQLGIIEESHSPW